MKRTLLTALLLAPLALLHAADVPATEPVTIVAFGDSTTAVRGSTKVYASVLQDELHNVRVINAGVPGNTTEMARKRFEEDVLRHQPQVAIIQFGINDAAVDVWKTPPATGPRVSLELYEANLRNFVQTLKSKNARVVLMTSNPLRWTPKLREMYGKPPYQPENVDGFNAPLAPYCEAARRVAREEGAELLDIQQTFVEHAQKRSVTVDSLLSDGMHPNDDGHRIEADLLRERILALAKTHALAITETPRWKASGEFVKIHPLCTDITHDSPNPTVLGCGLARMKDGAVMAVYSTPTAYYSTPGTTWIAVRVTKDGGKTWSAAKATTIDSNSSPGHFTRLTDGRIALVWNRAQTKRTELHLALSADEGKTWTPSLNVAQGAPGGATYPFAIEIAPGELWIGYHNVPKGWNFPRKRHLRLFMSSLMENVGQ